MLAEKLEFLAIGLDSRRLHQISMMEILMAQMPNDTRGKFDKFELIVYDWQDEVLIHKFFIQDENAINWFLFMWLGKYKGRRTLLRVHVVDLENNKIVWALGRIDDER